MSWRICNLLVQFAPLFRVASCLAPNHPTSLQLQTLPDEEATDHILAGIEETQQFAYATRWDGHNANDNAKNAMMRSEERASPANHKASTAGAKNVVAMRSEAGASSANHEAKDAVAKKTAANDNAEHHAQILTRESASPAHHQSGHVAVPDPGDATTYPIPGKNGSKLWIDPEITSNTTIPDGNLAVSTQSCSDGSTTLCANISVFTDSNIVCTDVGDYGPGKWALIKQPMSASSVGAPNVRFMVSVPSSVAICFQERHEDYRKIEQWQMWRSLGFVEETNRMAPVFSDLTGHMARCFEKENQEVGLVTVPRDEKTMVLVKAK